MAIWRSKHNGVANDTDRALMVRKIAKAATRQIRPSTGVLGFKKMRARTIYKVKVLSYTYEKTVRTGSASRWRPSSHQMGEAGDIRL